MVVPSSTLHNRVAIITGASSGLGVSCAVGFAEAGADVVLVARRRSRLDEVQRRVERTGGSCEVVVGDVADPATAEQAVRAATERFGKVDVLLNNAGVGAATPATREAPAEFRRVLEINLHGAYWMAQACGRVMPPGSSIINVSSVLALTTAGLPQAAYSSSKAGLLGLTRDLAAQWTGRKGIRVNALVPGLFETEMIDLYPDGYLEEALGHVPAGRLGKPEEFVAAALFLASEASSFITGAAIPIDGGRLLN